MEFIGEISPVFLKIVVSLLLTAIGVLLGLVFFFIRSAKESLDVRLNDIENKIEQVQIHIDNKTQFLVDKILSIAPEKEAFNSKIKQNLDRIITIEKAIGMLSVRFNTLATGYKIDVDNFKKILFKLRDEVNNLTRESNDDKNGSHKDTA